MTLSPAKAVRPEPKPSPAFPPEGSRQRVSTAFKGLQDRICQKLEAVDGTGKFQEDSWQRSEGAGGRSRLMKQRDVFEQGRVGFS